MPESAHSDGLRQKKGVPKKGFERRELPFITGLEKNEREKKKGKI